MLTNITETDNKINNNDNSAETNTKNEEDSTKSFIDNSNIGKIANELANDINLNDMNINNMGDIFSQLLGNNTSNNSGNNIMGLLTKVTDKIQNKLSSGEIDQNTLMQEATSMLNMISPNMTDS